jgi:predicted Zn-dependent protease with MMP-like domain
MLACESRYVQDFLDSHIVADLDFFWQMQLRFFSPAQLRMVKRAQRRAAALVTDFYCLAPREWQQMPYEVKTLRALDQSEIVDTALAQTLCYHFRREVGQVTLCEGDLYRICLQDHRILDAAQNTHTDLEALITYALTHELVHVVRFGLRLQRIDLPIELRAREEENVERTTVNILAKTGDVEIARVLSSRKAPQPELLTSKGALPTVFAV